MKTKVLSRYAHIEKLFRESKKEVVVGVMGSEASADHGGLTNIQIATFHEFGTEKIPERSFLRATLDEKRAELSKIAVQELGAVIKGERDLVTALRRFGLRIETAVRDRIRAGIAPGLKDSTIQAKKKKGAPIGANVPLIDTGQLIQSIRSEVRDVSS